MADDVGQAIAAGLSNFQRTLSQGGDDAFRISLMKREEEQRQQRELLNLQLLAAQSGIDPSQFGDNREGILGAVAKDVSSKEGERRQDKTFIQTNQAIAALDPFLKSIEATASAPEGANDTTGPVAKALAVMESLGLPPDSPVRQNLANMINASVETGHQRRIADVAIRKERQNLALATTQAQADIQSRKEIDTFYERSRAQFGLPADASHAAVEAEYRRSLVEERATREKQLGFEERRLKLAEEQWDAAQNSVVQKITSHDFEKIREDRKFQGQAITGLLRDLEKEGREFDPSDPVVMGRVQSIFNMYPGADTFPLIVRIPGTGGVFSKDKQALVQAGPRDLAQAMPEIQRLAAGGDPVAKMQYAAIAQHPDNIAIKQAIQLLGVSRESGKPLPPGESTPEGALLQKQKVESLQKETAPTFRSQTRAGRDLESSLRSAENQVDVAQKRVDAISKAATGSGRAASEARSAAASAQARLKKALATRDAMRLRLEELLSREEAQRKAQGQQKSQPARRTR